MSNDFLDMTMNEEKNIKLRTKWMKVIENKEKMTIDKITETRLRLER